MIWQVVAASTRGTGHIKQDLPCQDAFKFNIIENCAIAAVADGLGSAGKSEQGSKMAVESALAVLETALDKKQPVNIDEWEEILLNSFKEARQSLEHLAKSKDSPLRDFGTTLIVVAVTPEFLSVAHIGDGAVVALLEKENLVTVSPPQQGEYANETFPLTMPDAMKFVRCQSKPVKTHCVALMTDGLQSLSMNLQTTTPHAPFFTPFFEAVIQNIDTEEASKQLREFLDSERICERTDDDKTLVIIGKVQEPIP